ASRRSRATLAGTVPTDPRPSRVAPRTQGGFLDHVACFFSASNHAVRQAVRVRNQGINRVHEHVVVDISRVSHYGAGGDHSSIFYPDGRHLVTAFSIAERDSGAP